VNMADDAAAFVDPDLLALPRQRFGFGVCSHSTSKDSRGTAAFRQCEKVSRQVILGRASRGQNLETGPRRWGIAGHSGCDRFVCGGRLAAREEPFPF
jgi:hypothetical protein